MNRSLKIAGLLLLGVAAFPALLPAQESSVDSAKPLGKQALPPNLNTVNDTFDGVRDAANTAQGALDAGRQAVGDAANRVQQGAANVQNRINEIGNRVLPSGQTNAVPQYQSPQPQDQFGQNQLGQSGANGQYRTQLTAPSVPQQANMSDARSDREAPWRFTQQNGQWWYYSPDNQWMYYRDNQWMTYDSNTTAGQNNTDAMASASDRNNQSDSISGNASSDQSGSQSNMQMNDAMASNNDNMQARSSGYRGVQPSGNQMADGMQQSVASYHVPGTYVLHRDAWGREYICVNGSQVYFNQTANSTPRTMSKPQIDQPNEPQMPNDPQSGNAEEPSQSPAAASSGQDTDQAAPDQNASETPQNQSQSSRSGNANSQDASAQDSNAENTDSSQSSEEDTGLINGLFGGEDNEGNSTSGSETNSSGPDVFEDN